MAVLGTITPVNVPSHVSNTFFLISSARHQTNATNKRSLLDTSAHSFKSQRIEYYIKKKLIHTRK